MRVGFIGLGGMGRPMAANLLKAGHRLTVWNRSPGPAEALAAEGATVAASPAEAFAGDAVVSMLADDRATAQCLLDSGALDGAAAGLVHLSMATLSVAFTEELTRRHAAAGIAYLAAPVFGRTDLAEAARLNIAVAGPAEAVARVMPLLGAMGSRIWPMGEQPAQAAIVKIANNMMLINAVEAMGEALALTGAHGIAPTTFVDFVTATLFAAPAYQVYGPLIAAGGPAEAGFTLRLGLKDVGLALAAGQDRAVALPMASLARDTLLEAIAKGDGDKDLAELGRRAMKRAEP